MAEPGIDIERAGRALRRLDEELDRHLRAMRELEAGQARLRGRSPAIDESVEGIRAELDGKRRTIASLRRLLGELGPVRDRFWGG